MVAMSIVALYVAAGVVCAAAICLAWLARSESPAIALLASVLRMLVLRGRRQRGALSGIQLPVCVGDLTGPNGAALLTEMLRHGGHLSADASVVAVRDSAAAIRDGVKGDKAILEVEYAGKAALPARIFVKFNLAKPGAMRLLCEASEVYRCEVLFYAHLAKLELVPTPRCFFPDYCARTGEFALVSEVVRFGEGDVLPLKHRVRDEPSMEELRLLIQAGAGLNARLWSGSPELEGLPRFAETHRQVWLMAQLSAWLAGLRHTAKCTLRGAEVNRRWMTWRVPAGLLGRESELARDMPAIMESLCADSAMSAFGHNDLVTDNAYFVRDSQDGSLRLGGIFDWQQSCVNNVAQEWAWNFHFLPPAFLDEHEEELIDLVLATLRQHGRELDRGSFLEAYVLGTAQMFVWGGGGLQLLLRDLHKRGLFERLRPGDWKIPGASEDVDEALREKLVGAEMTRRTFTNCCNIMRRHDFVGAWERWRRSSGSAKCD